MGGEAVQYVDLRSYYIVDYPLLLGHLFCVAGYAVLHMFSRRGLLHLLKMPDELRSQLLLQVRKLLSSNI